MADNVAITAGSGTSIATDDAGAGGHVQIVKLAVSTDGSATALTANNTDGLLVNLGTNNDVTATNATAANLKAEVVGTGTFVTQVDGAALTALQLIDDSVFADDGAFTVGTSKVTVAGGVAVAHGSAPDAADAGDAVAPLHNRHRVQFTIGGHPNIVTLKHANITTAVTDTAIVASISAGTKVVVTRVTVSLDNASTVFPTVLIGFGTANTPTTTGVIFAHGGFPAGGQASVGDGSGIIGVGADDQELRITTTGNATGNGLQVTVSYYLIES
jgi:hypothetical protein